MKKTSVIAGLLLLSSVAMQAQEVQKEESTTILPEGPVVEVVESVVSEVPTMTAEELKAFNQQQKQIERERKAELKKQKEIAKCQKKIQKLTDKLNKTKAKYNKENDAFNRDMALGKIAPVQELKIKTKLHKYQTEIANLEFEIKAEEYKYENLTK
ncbi:hypothetical protein [Myroides sp. WP-1]|uniref:hypothetical protein n=1 Tax=Myroides sp. WP-1 TaxID=2759944 RepID=UPI0015FC5CA2|nr:hypothetical protein [Myroides sp. WP-1]MBB1138400.1 hypothetical protein [Myroides sp. WP-1]